MKSFALLGFMFGMFGVIGLVAAADKEDPTGIWKWKNRYGKNEYEQTLDLKYKDGKLSGTISGGGKGGGGTVSIGDGMFKNGEVSFSVTRNNTTTKYAGKLNGDVIKGSHTYPLTVVVWVAKREKDMKKVGKD